MTSSFNIPACDIAVFGTGQFAGRIIFDLAATSFDAIRVGIAGRNAERLDWLTTAANARAFMFGRPARFFPIRIDVTDDDSVRALLAAARPRLAVQTASSQPSSIIAQNDTAWARLIAEGGLSATAVTQAQLSLKVGEAIRATGIECALINCCFPDVVNTMLEARGIPVLCGTGNVAILSNAFSGALPDRSRKLRILAHYQQLSTWRQTADGREGLPPRVWIGDGEIADVFGEFAALKLTREPAIEISGASGVTLMQAFVAGRTWFGHAPGPNGLPGGYPVRLNGTALELDLPQGLPASEAIQWNARFEQECGLVVDLDGQATYTGRLKELLAESGFAYADGFHVSQLTNVGESFDLLRQRLEATPANAFH